MSNKISQYNNLISFYFIALVCILLTFAFAFYGFKSLLLKFGLVLTGSKFKNFRLGNGKS